jgi:hypothetical protein
MGMDEFAQLDVQLASLEEIAAKIDYGLAIIPIVRQGTTPAMEKMVDAVLNISTEGKIIDFFKELIDVIKKLWATFVSIVKFVWTMLKGLVNVIYNVTRFLVSCAKIKKSVSAERYTDRFTPEEVRVKTTQIPLTNAYAFYDEVGQRYEVFPENFAAIGQLMEKDPILDQVKVSADAVYGMLKELEKPSDKRIIETIQDAHDRLLAQVNEELTRISVEDRRYGKEAKVRIYPIPRYPGKGRYEIVFTEGKLPAVDFISNALNRKEPSQVMLPPPDRAQVIQLADTIGAASTSMGKAKHRVTYYQDFVKAVTDKGEDVMKQLDRLEKEDNEYAASVKLTLSTLTRLTTSSSRTYKNTIRSASLLLSSGFTYMNKAADNILAT